jgi:hypothetical protein
MSTDTETSRGSAWGLQTDYTTQKTIAAAALTKIIGTDTNTIDYSAKVNNDDGWGHGKNQATEQWIEPMTHVSINRWRLMSMSLVAYSS